MPMKWGLRIARLVIVTGLAVEAARAGGAGGVGTGSGGHGEGGANGVTPSSGAGRSSFAHESGTEAASRGSGNWFSIGHSHSSASENDLREMRGSDSAATHGQVAGEPVILQDHGAATNVSSAFGGSSPQILTAAPLSTAGPANVSGSQTASTNQSRSANHNQNTRAGGQRNLAAGQRHHHRHFESNNGRIFIVPDDLTAPYDDSDAYADSSPDSIYSDNGGDTFDVSVVALVEQLLANQGYYNGPPDGKIGVGLRRAIGDYQFNHGLVISGMIDEALLASL